MMLLTIAKMEKIVVETSRFCEGRNLTDRGHGRRGLQNEEIFRILHSRCTTFSVLHHVSHPMR